MSQGSLYVAIEYLALAYDRLVLAYNQADREEIALLKNAVLRTYVGLRQEWQEMNLPLETTEDQVTLDAPF